MSTSCIPRPRGSPKEKQVGGTVRALSPGFPPTPTWAWAQGLWVQGLGVPVVAEEKHLAWGGVACSGCWETQGLWIVPGNIGHQVPERQGPS